ncbi:citrate synthase [Mycobacterium tuberculosis]|nr:citrate synthase [Mycobacterium tuberculosis]
MKPAQGPDFEGSQGAVKRTPRVITRPSAQRLTLRAAAHGARDPTPGRRVIPIATTFSYKHLVGQPYQPKREGVLVADTDDTATLRYPGGEIDLQIVHATEGADGIALGPLLAKTGHTTFDVGFANTAAAKSSITYIDGDAGILRYAATRSTNWRRSQPSSRSATC